MISSLVKSKILFGLHKFGKFLPQIFDYLTRTLKSSMEGGGAAGSGGAAGRGAAGRRSAGHDRLVATLSKSSEDFTR
ncbi:MAG: hypothetical protein IPP37_14700 [Saprospiraceae bacterium]|nr:hypothetical protein [Saprospiraceae bacterium]